METSKLVGMIIGLAVAVIVVTTVLLPVINDATNPGTTEDPNTSYVGDTFAPLVGVIAIMGILVVVMVAVKALRD